MKTAGIVTVIICSLTFMLLIGFKIYAHYDYDNKILANWELADMASTLSQKHEYIDRFVKAIESYSLNGTNAKFIFKTPDSDFNENLKALKSLQSRLSEISKMNPNSFEYQIAIQQITAQESGEAKEMLRNLYQCWLNKEYYALWNPVITGLIAIFSIIFFIFGTFLISSSGD